MPFHYDPEDGNQPERQYPKVGEAVAVHIGQCKETTSRAGNPMVVLNCEVTSGVGLGYRFKEYLVKKMGWKIRQIMRSVGLDPDRESGYEVDDMLFRNREGEVIFRAEPYTTASGEARTGLKVDKWIPSETESDPAPNPDTPVDNSEIPF